MADLENMNLITCFVDARFVTVHYGLLALLVKMMEKYVKDKTTKNDQLGKSPGQALVQVTSQGNNYEISSEVVRQIEIMVINGTLALEHDRKNVILHKAPQQEQEKGEASKHEDTRQAAAPIEHTAVSKPPEIPSHWEEKEKSISTKGNDVKKRPSSVGIDPERKIAALQKDEDEKGKAEHEQVKRNSRKTQIIHLDNTKKISHRNEETLKRLKKYLKKQSRTPER